MNRKLHRPRALRKCCRWRSNLSPVLLLLAILLFCGCPAARAQCDSLKSGDELWVRLLQPLSSYSGKAGDKIEAMVIESPLCEGIETIAAGTLIKGDIKTVRSVGLGVKHQTAQLEVDFNRIEANSGEVPMTSRLLEIDNAREAVKNGVIHGINPTNAPEGRITGRLTHLPLLNPYGDMALLAYRMTFPVFPEPEIYLPRGTDMKLVLTAELHVPEEERGAAPSGAPDETDKAVLEITAAELPERTTTPHGKNADIVNMALLGTRGQVDAAFRAAGWTNSAPTTTKSVFHEMYAIMAFTNYPELPMSEQLVDGQDAATTWEKGLDSYQKREHLRLWARNDLIEGQTVWLGAVSRETSAVISVRRRKFVHHIDADLDTGRGFVMRDLDLAGCVQAVYYVQRPDATRAAINATGDPMRTDGSLAVVQLKDCENPVFERTAGGPGIATHPKSKMKRYARMLVMNFKTDLVRSNVIYGTYDLTRMLIQARRSQAERTMMARRIETKPQPRPQPRESATLAAPGGGSAVASAAAVSAAFVEGEY